MNFEQLLRFSLDQHASDVHLLTGASPALRIAGQLRTVEGQSVTEDELRAFIASLSSENDRTGAVFARELRLKELYPKMVVEGRETLGTSEAYVVEATPTEGSPDTLYYDVTSGLVVRQLVTRQSAIGPLEVDIALEDYRAVDGVKRPFRIRQVTTQFTAVVQLSEVTHNAPIDDSMFRKPK